MGNFSGGGKAICPFYIKEARLSITCEGLIAGTCAMTRFLSVEQKIEFQEKHCDVYEYETTCPMAVVLFWKYAEEESG